MNFNDMLFNEIYGTYYNTVAKIIEKALDGNLTSDGLYNCIMENAYSESVVPITDSVEKEKWQLLKFEREKNHFTSIIKRIPQMPLTKLQLQYLKAILNDSRIRLFDLDFDSLENELKDVVPLWNPDDYEVFDKFRDGDDFDNENYKKCFRIILDAKSKGLSLDFLQKNRHGNDFWLTGIPDKIEYSEKDDKFRVVLAGRSESRIIRIGKILDVRISEKGRNMAFFEFKPLDIDTIVLELKDDRNALERVSMHFANLKKKTVKLDNNKYRMELEFRRDDDFEMVIRLLQFGPMIKVLEPKYIVDEIVKRISMQLRLLSQ